MRRRRRRIDKGRRRVRSKSSRRVKPPRLKRRSKEKRKRRSQRSLNSTTRWKAETKKSKKLGGRRRLMMEMLKPQLRWNSMTIRRTMLLRIRLHCRLKGRRIIMTRMSSLTARRKAAVDRNSLRLQLQLRPIILKLTPLSSATAAITSLHRARLTR